MEIKFINNNYGETNGQFELTVHCSQNWYQVIIDNQEPRDLTEFLEMQVVHYRNESEEESLGCPHVKLVWLKEATPEIKQAILDKFRIEPCSCNGCV